jgi:putative membrane protein
MPSDGAPPGRVVTGRLHPLTAVVALRKQVGWVLPAAVGILVVGDVTSLWTLFPLALAVAASLAHGVVRYFVFSYRLDAAELVIRDGVLSRTERHIPLERVQDVEIEQGPLHRLLGLADVRVQTAGGGDEPEAALSAVSAADAERLRVAIAEGARRLSRAAAPAAGVAAAPVGAAQDEEAAVVRRLSVREIVVAGLTSKVVGPMLAAAGAVWAFADDVLPEGVYRSLWESAADVARQAAAEGFRGRTALVAALALVSLVPLALVVSAVWSVALFYGFTLARAGEDLRRSYGLLTRRTGSLPRRRIQLVEVEQSPLRRLLGLAALRADTAGGSSGEKGGRDLLIPIVRADEVEALLPALFPDVEPEPSAWRRVSPRAVARGARTGAVPLLAASALLAWLWGWGAALWPLALLPLVYAASALSYRGLGYAVAEGHLRTRRGWLGRSTHVVPIRNIQALTVRQSPFDRRLGLATLVVDTAGQAFTGGGPRIRCLPADEARVLAADLARRAAETRYRC